MDIDKIQELFNNDEFEDGGIERDWTGDNAMQGLMIIAKHVDYKNKKIICGAGHDEMYSVGIEDMPNITEDEVMELVRLNWCLDEDNYLSCYV